MPFQQFQGRNFISTSGIEDHLLDLNYSVSDTERRRAGQLASVEGTVSIMFTDLESSTELLSSLGDTIAQNLLRTHNQMVREQVARYSGVEVKSMGDGFMLVFSSARRALECAVAIQRSFHQHNTAHPRSQLNVRIGVNVGEAIKEEEDFFGTAVVVAARVASQARGGQILVSELFRRVVGSAGDFHFIDLGYQRLKGLPEEHRLFEVRWTPSDA
jgi:class 3 adenylate cyclase